MNLRAEEAELLVPWLAAFERCFGAPAETRAIERQLAPSEPLFTLSYAPIEESPILGQTGHFGQTSELSSHVASLGYGWDDAGCIRSAPTPATFNLLLSRLGDDAGFPLEFQVEDSESASLGAWLLRYMRGVIPIHVASESFYQTAHTMRLRWHVTSLIHDLTVHALNYHLVPRSCVRELGDRIRRSLPERADAWREPGASAPLTLSYFYDNDLNRYCYAVWNACSKPSDFASRFERTFSQLVDALDVRIAETRAGKGDVASNDTREMPPLQKTEFSVGRA